MSELPKIALQRLKASSSTAKAAGAGPGPFPGSEHLDANLLSALAEQSLTSVERNQVLEHLGRCTECRAVAALILPADAGGAVFPEVAQERRWNLWPVLRWGSLVAALGVVTIVVAVHSNLWRSNRGAASAPLSSASAGKAPEPLQAYAPAPPPLTDVRNKAPREEADKEKDALQKRAEGESTSDQLRPPTKKEVSTMAASQPPARLRIENAPGAGMSRRESLGDRAMSAREVPPPIAAPPPPPPASASAASAGKTSADSVSTTQTVPVTAQAPTVQSEYRQQVGLAGGEVATSASGSGAPKSTGHLGQQSKAQAKGGMFEMMAARRSLKASAPAVVWSISAGGKVQRSADGAKTFDAIEIIPGVKFTAVAAIADEVWAGGENGALFHSLDGGASWAQVQVGTGASKVQESISAIEFSAGGKLALVTASGARWISNDDGHNWNQLP